MRNLISRAGCSLRVPSINDLRIGKRLFAPRAWSVAAHRRRARRVRVRSATGSSARSAGKAGAHGVVHGRQGASTVDAAGLGFESLDRYQHVRLRGRYDGARQVLLDNIAVGDRQPRLPRAYAAAALPTVRHRAGGPRLGTARPPPGSTA